MRAQSAPVQGQQALPYQDPPFLPPITSAFDNSNRELHFPVKVDTVCDLINDDDDVGAELRRLQQVLHSNRVHLENVYLVSGKSRRDFADFAHATSGIDKGPANEIFSIATDRFAAEEDKVGHGTDCTMSRSQFATAIVRLSNLHALIQDGPVEASRISEQTEEFLQASK